VLSSELDGEYEQIHFGTSAQSDINGGSTLMRQQYRYSQGEDQLRSNLSNIAIRCVQVLSVVPTYTVVGNLSVKTWFGMVVHGVMWSPRLMILVPR
jgi:L-lactate utilization protein LutB